MCHSLLRSFRTSLPNLFFLVAAGYYFSTLLEKVISLNGVITLTHKQFFLSLPFSENIRFQSDV